MSAFVLASRRYTPLAFRPSVERVLASGLVLAAGALWAIVIPLELILA